jgi:putative endonuclease
MPQASGGAPMRSGWLNRLFGNRGEGEAVRFLKQLGYKIVTRQMRNRYGEVDIIAQDHGTIVFVEVKTRKSLDSGHPTEAVTRDKQTKITRAALAWLKSKRLLHTRARFDVIAIVWSPAEPQIQHFISAFDAAGDGQFFT